jgi:hypothetical protein
MASENIYLLAFAIVLFTINAVLGGRLAETIAGFFGRISHSKSSKLDGAGEPKSGERARGKQGSGESMTSRRAA